MTDWLRDETRSLTEDQAWDETRRNVGFAARDDRSPIAVTLHDVTIHNTRQWFDRPTEVRLDALFVSPTAVEIYHPATFGFAGVRDGTRLPIDENGIVLYLGDPRYFLDIALIASQGGSNATLGELLAQNADNLGDLLGNVTVLAAPTGPAAAVTGAAAAAAKLSATALRLLDEMTGKSIGLYRVTWWEQRDRFGLGQHPSHGGQFRERDFEFRYEIFQDAPAST